MMHLLPAHTSGVDDDAKAVGRPLLARQARRHGEELAQHSLVARVAIRQRIDMFLGDDHEMHRGERMDVVESENIGVLVDFSAGNFSPDDLAEDAVFRVPPYCRSTFGRRLSARAAFSSIAEMPSRRRSSASTWAGRKPYCASMIRQWNHRSAVSPTMRSRSPSFAAITASVASSPTFFRIASGPRANSRDTSAFSGSPALRDSTTSASPSSMSLILRRFPSGP